MPAREVTIYRAAIDRTHLARNPYAPLEHLPNTVGVRKPCLHSLAVYSELSSAADDHAAGNQVMQRLFLVANPRHEEANPKAYHGMRSSIAP